MYSTDSSEVTLAVIDPCNRTGKISLPMTQIVETKGVSDYLRYEQALQAGARVPPSQVPRDLSLCLLFQSSRCHAGVRCNQVHANPDFVAQLRFQASTSNGCCAAHGDVHSIQFMKIAESQVIVIDQADETCYSLSAFARTVALDNALHRSAGHIPRVYANRICRLHRSGRCKFGKDCKNIHLCRDAKPIAAQESAQVMLSQTRSISRSSGSSRSESPTPVSMLTPPATPPPLTVFSTPSTTRKSYTHGIDTETEFDSIRYDPLEFTGGITIASILTLEGSANTLTDFEEFVEALVDCKMSPLKSPSFMVTP